MKMFSTLKDKLKSKFTKKSTRGGITFSDKELFEVGSEFKYVITEGKVLIIKKDKFEEISKDLQLENTSIFNGKVSKKGQKEIPLIDIRRKEAMAAFGKADTLVVDIYGDVVVVSGYENIEPKESESQKDGLLSKFKATFNKTKKVVNLNEVKLKKKFEVRLSKKQLLASGEQISFDFESLFSGVAQDVEKSAFSGIKQAFENLEIPLRAASFFAGAGLFDEGFIQAGFDVVFAIEKDEAAAQTYVYNHGENIICGDVRTFNKDLVKGIPVFFGGPPCQGFSNANRYTNFLDNENNMLVKSYIDIIKSNSDLKVFVLENVPQILTAGDGMFKDEIIKELSEFEITYGVLNSADYGSPQLRKRAVFIGSKIGKIDLPEPILLPHQYVTVGEALMDIDEDAPNQKDFSKPRPDTLERMKHVPQGGNWEFIPEELRTNKMSQGTHSSVYKRLDESKPSITITNPRKSNIIHPIFNRIISVREAARLFGLKDGYKFLGKLADKQQQIANAVPVHLGMAIAKGIKIAIQQFNIRLGFSKPALI